jgi:hypothetical protein
MRTLRVKLSLARPFIVTADWAPRRAALPNPVPEPRVQPLLWSA